jgi:chemotaxis protein methyltransferase CheR
MVTDHDFAVIRKLLQEHCALVLDPGKEYLVEARLTPLAQRLQLASIAELIARLRSEPLDNGLQRQIVEAMVTTESLFFRDHTPFEALRQSTFPDLIRRRQSERCLRIWCAASSTGQEPYSVAILLREHFPELAGWTVSLLASDVSQQVLARAKAGRYNQIEVNRGLPAALLVKYFDQHGTSWQLKPAIRGMVDFQEINLARPWPALPRMDLVLIRNVMIYFGVDTKKIILGKLAHLLRPDGYLLLGGAETTFNLDSSYRRVEPIKAGLYQLIDQANP